MNDSSNNQVSKNGFIKHIGGIEFKKISENNFEFQSKVQNFNLFLEFNCKNQNDETNSDSSFSFSFFQYFCSEKREPGNLKAGIKSDRF